MQDTITRADPDTDTTQDNKIMSGWINKEGEPQKWFGCGTAAELHEVYMQLQDDAVQDREAFPGKLTMTPATKEEIDRFTNEAGDGWGEKVIQRGKYFYYRDDQTL